MNNKELIDKYEDKLKDVQFKFGANFKTKVYEELLDDLKQLDEPEPIKLRDVIARIKQLDIGTRKVWLDEFLNELGSDYGALKYKAGYEQGKFEASTIPYEEPQKVQVSEEEAKFLETFDFNCESDVTTAYSYTKTTPTRKELEEAGFGEVFDSPLFEVEEVEG